MQLVKVIFACVHNAGRSQMAAAFFNHYADRSKAEAASAGTQPADKVHDCVLHSMREAGIDLSNVKPQLLTDELAAGANLLITMGCGETCPFVPGLQREDWPLPDPKGKSDNEVCAIRDEIKARVLRLLNNLNALDHFFAGRPALSQSTRLVRHRLFSVPCLDSLCRFSPTLRYSEIKTARRLSRDHRLPGI